MKLLTKLKVSSLIGSWILITGCVCLLLALMTNPRLSLFFTILTIGGACFVFGTLITSATMIVLFSSPSKQTIDQPDKTTE